MSEFDILEYMKTPEDIAGYLNAVFDNRPSEPAYCVYVLGQVMRAARNLGLVDELPPEVDLQSVPVTFIFELMNALGLQFALRQLD